MAGIETEIRGVANIRVRCELRPLALRSAGARIVPNPQRVDCQRSVEIIPGDSVFFTRCSPSGVSKTPQGELGQLAVRGGGPHFCFLLSLAREVSGLLLRRATSLGCLQILPFLALFPVSQIWPQMSQNTIDGISFIVIIGGVKMFKPILLAATLVIGTQVRATLYDITYSDPSGNAGSGILTAVANGDGSYTVVSGSFSLTAGAFAGANGALVPNPNAPAPWTQRVYGGTDFIGLDDQLFPSATSFLDVYGLLFNDTLYPRPGGVGLAFNLYYYSGSYQLLVNGYNNEPWANNYAGGTATIADPVPEPTTMVAGALLLLPFGASALRMLRRKQTT